MMPVRKITEQQFRTRRKDRKMVYVDAAALLVGLLVLAVSVGGVIVIEPEPEPIEWEYSFAEGKVGQKWCAGTSGQREGCKSIDSRDTPEGEPQALLMNPIEAPNVTQAVFRLTWTDDEPDVEDQKGDHYGKTYTYDENSTDTLRLEVTSPWGETWTGQGTNDVELKSGVVEIVVNISTAPEPGAMKAFEKATVQRALAAQHTETGHKALGEWQAIITVVHARDQNGTVANDACADAPDELVGAFPDDLREKCYTDDEQDRTEDYSRAAPGYTSTYVDKGNRWVLEFFVRTYSASVTF